MPGVVVNFDEINAELRDWWIASGLPDTRAQPTLGAAIVIDHRADDAVRLVPLVVVDFYREQTE